MTSHFCWLCAAPVPVDEGVRPYGPELVTDMGVAPGRDAGAVLPPADAA